MPPTRREVLTTPGGEARSALPRTPSHRDDRRRHQRESGAERGQQPPGRIAVRCSCRWPRSPKQQRGRAPPATGRRRARGRTPKRATSRGAGGEPAKIESVIGRKARPASSASVACHFLQVEGDEVPHREACRRRAGRRSGWRRAAAGIRKTRSGISGSRGERALDQGEERRAAPAPSAERDEHAGGAPAERVGADDAVDERGEAAADQDARRRGRSLRSRADGAASRGITPRDRRARTASADRDVDEEDRAASRSPG